MPGQCPTSELSSSFILSVPRVLSSVIFLSWPRVSHAPLETSMESLAGLPVLTPLRRKVKERFVSCTLPRPLCLSLAEQLQRNTVPPAVRLGLSASLVVSGVTCEGGRLLGRSTSLVVQACAEVHLSLGSLCWAGLLLNLCGGAASPQRPFPGLQVCVQRSRVALGRIAFLF